MTGNINCVSRYQIKGHLCFTIFEKGLEGGNQVGLCDLFADSSLGDINNYTFQNIFYHLNHQHDEYLQFCEFVSDHVAHSPGLILSTLSQGWHHLWNFVRKLLNINTKIQMLTKKKNYQLFHIFGLEKRGNGHTSLHSQKSHRVLINRQLVRSLLKCKGNDFTAPNSDINTKRQENCRFSINIHRQ